MMRAGRLTPIVLATLGALAGGLVFSSAPALALTKYVHVSSFASGGSPYGLAVDQANGEVFVADGSSVQRFSPVNRSNPSEGYSLGSPLAGSFGFAFDVGVDDSGGLSQGDVYVADLGAGVVDKFEASGSPVEVNPPSNKTNQFAAIPPPALPLAEPAGVAVDPANGDVYVSDAAHRVVDVYEPTGVFLTQFFPTGSGPTGLAFNSSGSDLYVEAGGRVEEFDASGRPVDQTAGPNAGISNVVDGREGPSAVAVDPATNDVYVYQQNTGSVAVFESSGAPLSPPEFSAGGGAFFGLAVDGFLGTVYVSESEHGAVSVYQLVVFPEVITGGASGETETSATLKGTVNPEGVPVTACHFKYDLGSVPCLDVLGAEVGTPVNPIASPTEVHAAIVGLQVNTSYSYNLVAANASVTEEGATKTFTTLAALPTVNDQPPSASVITRTTARLSGTIDPEHSPTEYHFEYGTTTAYGSKTEEASAGSGYDDVSVGPQRLVELQPETTYHYRLVATNEAVGTETGPDYTFTTASRTPPLVSTGEASGVTQTGATISGTVGPQGIDTSYVFEVGTDTSYSGAKVFGDAGQGEGVEPIAVGLQDLAPGTTYHYRITATNADGTSYGQDMTFATPGVPSPIVQPLTLPLLATPSVAFPTEEKATTTKKLTNAQKLTNALKACKKERKKKQAGCMKQARKRYGAKPKAKKGAKGRK